MFQKIAFTICSVNYLAQAKVLGESLKRHNPDYKFYIGLCDVLENRGLDKSKIEGFEIIEVDKIGIDKFDEMCERYDITELNTAIKPFFIDYFFKANPNTELVYYIDPDIEIFDKFDGLEDLLKTNNIVLTPHFYTPIFDDQLPREQEMFVNGIYNLGFLAVKKSTEVDKFMHWWQEKLRTECYMDIKKGMFVDQLYCNMVPLYFEGVHIEKNPGYNMAYWNLHERTLTVENGKYYSNKVPLIFYHYSGMDAKDPNNISRWIKRYDLNNRPDLVKIFTDYKAKISEYDNDYFKTFKCVYAKDKDLKPKKSFLKKVLTSVSYRTFAFFDSLPI